MTIKLTFRQRRLLRALKCLPLVVAAPPLDLADNTLEVLVPLHDFDAWIDSDGNLRGSRQSIGIIMSVVGKVACCRTANRLWEKLLQHISWEEYKTEFMRAAGGWASED